MTIRRNVILTPHIFPFVLWPFRLFIYIYIYIYFIIQRVKACAWPCPHQLPTRNDNIFSVAQDCHSWRYQAAFATGQGIYIYIYIYVRLTKRRNYIVCSSSFFVQFLFPFGTKLEGTRLYSIVGDGKGAVML